MRAEIRDFGHVKVPEFDRMFAKSKTKTKPRQKRKMKKTTIKNIVALVAAGAITTTGAFANCGADHKSEKTIVGVAAANKDFSTLVAAVKAAEIVDTRLVVRREFLVAALEVDQRNLLLPRHLRLRFELRVKGSVCPSI